MSEGIFLTCSRISIACFISAILLSSLINFEYNDEQIEQNDTVNELTAMQDIALADARSSGVDIGWERQFQSEGAGNEYGEAIVVDISGNAYVSGVFCFDLKLGSISLDRFGICDLFLAKISPNGNWIWATQVGGEAAILLRYTIQFP